MVITFIFFFLIEKKLSAYLVLDSTQLNVKITYSRIAYYVVALDLAQNVTVGTRRWK